MSPTARPQESVDSADDVARRLIALITEEIDGAQDVRIAGLRRTSGGFSRENWIFDATWRAGGTEHSRPLILRRDPVASPLDTERDAEFRLLRALEDTDVPAPAVYWLDQEGTRLGRPAVVMERVGGDCDWTVLNSERPLNERLALAWQFTEILAHLHSVDWKRLGLDTVLGAPATHAAAAELDRWSEQLREVQLEPLPEMVFVETWLRAHLPPAGDIVLVHSDYKPGNALVSGDRFSAVLDWETAHLGDPLEDLGWMTNPARKKEQQISGAWERAQIVGLYQELTGREIAESDLLWWNILMTWRLSITTLTMVKDFVEGQSDRVSQTPTWLFRRMFSLIEEAQS